MKQIRKNSTQLVNALLAGGIVAMLGTALPLAAMSEDATPQARSDGPAAAVVDTATTAKVKVALMNKQGLKKSDISVTTTNGVVTLDGAASSSRAKTEAATVTEAVSGVKSVDNNLTTPTHSKAAASGQKTVAMTEKAMSDSWITTKVKSEITADSLSKGLDVGVTTTHGVVVLKGDLASQNAIEHVKAIAGKVEGVKSVDTTGLNVTVSKTP